MDHQLVRLIVVYLLALRFYCLLASYRAELVLHHPPSGIKIPDSEESRFLRYGRIKIPQVRKNQDSSGMEESRFLEYGRINIPQI